jgi:S-formylglutathione hydrolase FrmB
VRRGTLAIAIVGLLAFAPAAGAALPSVESGHRPGPDALYAPPPAEVPQLENAGPWRAAPILVSGTQAYRDGEWLYQDYLHDDHGAAGARDETDPYGIEAHLFSPPAGTMTYPTDPVYAHNAADLVELRIRQVPGATAFRVTLNTLKDPARTGFTIALGSSAGPRPWPHGAGVTSPADRFVTVHGSTAEIRDATTGAVLPGGATATVDTRRRQVDVRVSHSAWNPGAGKQRVTIGVGLWDEQAGGYLKPGSEATGTRPGGASPAGVALFNVGPRFSELMPEVSQYGAGYTIGDAAAGAAVQAAWWRERVQADQLRAGDVAPFAAEVDFGKLAAGTDDDSAVPKDGPMNRILASRHEFGQGIEPSRVCFEVAGFSAGARCEGRFVGQLQPYAIYVPRKPRPARGYGLTLLLHSLSANYNQYSASKNQSQLGERGPGSIVVTPSGRGPDGFYAGIAEADTFEVWADVARLYELDPDWVAVSGYSMGGFGTFRLLARWPDLFGRGMATVGAPGSVADQLVSLRNTPIMTWNAAADELVNVRTSEQMVTDMTTAGIRFTHWFFPTADHLTLATNDEYGPAAEFLGEHRADRSPVHVTYVVDPSEDSATAGAIGDHAYWVSGLRRRDAAAPRGTIDARSAAFGVGDPPVTGVTTAQGTLQGGAHGPMPYQERQLRWGDQPALARTRKLFVKATNIGAATFDGTRAGVGCAPKLYLATDGPLDMRVECAQRPRRAKRCASRVGVTLPRVAARPNAEVTATRNGRTLARRSAGRILRLSFRRPTRKAFSVDLAMRAGGDGPALSLGATRQFGACGR